MATEFRKRDTFRFDNQTWKVTEIYNITWKDGTFSKEYKLKSNIGLIRYLEIEEDFHKKKKPEYSFWQEITDRKTFLSRAKYNLNKKVAVGNAEFPKVLEHNGVTYTFNKRYDGVCEYDYDDDEVINALDYSNRDDSKLLSIEIWDDETEISLGFPIEEQQITNIIRRKESFTDSPFFEKLSRRTGEIIIAAFILLFIGISKCSHKTSWNSDSRNYNDSTKVHRSSNNYYRGRSSGGFGK